MDISIIVPSYNARSKIDSCISSLNNINYDQAKYEVIFIDDCSTDGTYQYLLELTDQHDNWILSSTQTNSGSPSAPRNLGIKLAQGEFVFFLDCDDEILSDTLYCHFELAKSTNADIVRGYLLVDTGNIRYSTNHINSHREFSTLSKKEKVETIIKQQSTTVPSLIRRSLIINHNIEWDSSIKMGEDTIFLVELLTTAQNVQYIDHPTFIYNKKLTSNASSTQSYGSRELKNHLKVWSKTQTLLSTIDVDYYSLRLQIALQSAIQAMISFNKHDISQQDFIDLSNFYNVNRLTIDSFSFSDRLKGVISTLSDMNYDCFLEEIKPRLVIAGFDLKFIKTAINQLSKYYKIIIDEWTGHNSHNEQHSNYCLKWGEVFFCEWMLGNAVWYSQRVNTNQKIFIRMHRFELTTQWYKQIDFTKVNRVFAVSVYFFEKLVEITSIPRGLGCVLPNYLDYQQYEKTDSEEKLFNIGIIGILPSRKGYLKSLKILKLLVEKDLRYTLSIFGKMPEEIPWIKNDSVEMRYYNECIDFIENNNLSKHVIIKGWVDVKKDIKDIGFILSTSHADELFESFHIAPADAFASGNQGLLLKWNGVEYIYPNQYIFDSEESLAAHILNQNSLAIFNDFNREGIALVKERYSLNQFILNFLTAIKLSEEYFKEAPKPPILDASNSSPEYKLISESAERISLNNVDTVSIPVPKEYINFSSFLLKYDLQVYPENQGKAALISLVTEPKCDVQGFVLSDYKEIGLFKYLDSNNSGNLKVISFDIPEGCQLVAVKVKLWRKDLKVILKNVELYVSK